MNPHIITGLIDAARLVVASLLDEGNHDRAQEQQQVLDHLTAAADIAEEHSL